jgi:hypothetical protein
MADGVCRWVILAGRPTCAPLRRLALWRLGRQFSRLAA